MFFDLLIVPAGYVVLLIFNHFVGFTPHFLWDNFKISIFHRFCGNYWSFFNKFNNLLGNNQKKCAIMGVSWVNTIFSRDHKKHPKNLSWENGVKKVAFLAQNRGVKRAIFSREPRYPLKKCLVRIFYLFKSLKN